MPDLVRLKEARKTVLLNQFDALPVTLGQGDAAQVVVTEGLEAGQILALNPPDLKQDFSKRAKKTEGDSAKPK